MQSPSDYAREYHKLKVHTEAAPALSGSVNITRYQNGTRPDCDVELWRIIGYLTLALKLKNWNQIPRRFHFPSGDKIMAAEPFYWVGLKRCFMGKGSPSEIKDALRLAARFNRLKATNCPNLDAYAKKFLGLDCNALVGNYFGISPALSIESWAHGWTGKKAMDELSPGARVKAGLGEAEELSLKKYFPLKPRTSAREIRNNDVLVTVTPGGIYKHVAVVHDVVAVDDNNVTWTVVEWGEEGPEAKHVKPGRKALLEKGKKRGALELGFKHEGNFRYVLAAPCEPKPASWGRCEKEDI
jgi:hypothetical protein